MIVQLIFNSFARFIQGVIDTMPDLPAEVTSLLLGMPSAASTVFGSLAKLDPVLPFVAVNTSVKAIIIGWGTALAIRLVRALISYGTGGGGA